MELSGIYLIYGEEMFLIEETYKKIKKQFGQLNTGINYINIDETNLELLLTELQTPAFGYEKKLVVVRDTLLKKEGKKKNTQIKEVQEKLLEFLIKNKEDFEMSNILIIIEENCDDKAKLFKYIEKEYKTYKMDFQRPVEIEKKLISICNAYKVELNSQVARYFIECCGTNMQELINEIRKLIEYVGENGVIKKEHIDMISTKKFESIIFDLTDELGKKNIKQGLQTLDNLIFAKEPIQKILITLYNHFKKIYITKLCIKTNKELAINLKLKPNQTFLINKYKTQARCFEEPDLKEILIELIELDSGYKLGKIDIEVGLRSILCRYCG